MIKMNLQLFASVLKPIGKTQEDEKNGKLVATSNRQPTLTANSVNLKGVDSGLVSKMNTTFSASQSYVEAMNYTNELLKKISEGRTSYTDQIKDLMGDIQNRPKFEYDVNSDPLFQQALSSAMGSGKTAMQDTIGQASALTGGYGSTYATSAGNQQYNAFIEDAHNNIPEYYQMAMQAYQMEGDELYNQLGMLTTADATEYQRMYDAWGANFSNTQQMYQNEYQKWSDEVTNAFNLAGMQNSDWWNNTNFTEQQRQYNASLAEQQRQFDKEMEYRKSTAGGSGGNGNKTKDPVYKEPSSTELKNALDAYNSGGDEALYKYVASLGSDIDAVKIHEYIESYGRGNLEGRTFTMISPGASKKYAGKVNHGILVDGYGNEYTLAEIEKINPTIAAKLKGIKRGEKIKV